MMQWQNDWKDNQIKEYANQWKEWHEQFGENGKNRLFSGEKTAQDWANFPSKDGYTMENIKPSRNCTKQTDMVNWINLSSPEVQ